MRRKYKNREYIRLSKMLGDIVYTGTDSDFDIRLEDQIVKRDRKYTELLISYTRVTKVRFVLKEIHKWLFFWLIIAACIFCLYSAYGVIQQTLKANNLQVVVDAVPAILAAFTALISTVVVVPLTITKFLFNEKEDDNITEVIQHTQEHDASGMNLLKNSYRDKSTAKVPPTKLSGTESQDE